MPDKAKPQDVVYGIFQEIIVDKATDAAKEKAEGILRKITGEEPPPPPSLKDRVINELTDVFDAVSKVADENHSQSLQTVAQMGKAKLEAWKR
jgi:hypothetical protein